ncbi:MAG: hypothetical protein V3V33_14195 [Candidatus Lokiarchaeia archaeon]
MGFKKRCFNFSKRFIREKDGVIRAESIVCNDEWNKYKKLIGKGYEWYIITPANYDYCKCVYNLKIEKEEFIKILKERIKFLKEHKEKIQLSIFLCKVKKFLDDNLQEEKFKEAFEFLNEVNLKPEKFYPIDMVYNQFTLKIAEKYGLEKLTDFSLFINKLLLKIIKLIGIKLSFINSLYNFLKMRDYKNIVYLILGELRDVKEKTVHTEAFMRNDLWNSIKNKIIGKAYTWFVITPADYEYCKIYFNINIDKNKFTNTLKERIKFLKDNNEEIQLHIHLCMYKNLLDNKLQERKFHEAMDFMNSLDIKPNKFVAGWWIFNRKTVNIAKKYGFKEIFDYTINPFRKKIKINGISLSYVHKYWHDFDFI